VVTSPFYGKKESNKKPSQRKQKGKAKERPKDAQLVKTKKRRES
jgi:hypothetical protein